MSVYKQLFLFLTILTINQQVRAHPCPDCSPCECIGDDIDCKYKRLTSVPPLIGNPNINYELYLCSNPNIVITDDTFENITLKYLSLRYNKNMSLSHHALRNQRNTLNTLRIDSAQLDKLPEALRDLDELQLLDVRHNNIKHLDETLMQKLGFKLTYLDISHNALKHWPASFRYLSNLQTLKINGNKIGVIPHNAFNGFHLKLKYLNIKNTGILEMPTGLHTLEGLEELHVGGLLLNDSSFYEGWLPSQSCKCNLKKLHIIFSKITRIPFGLGGNTRMTTLKIYYSKIKHVDENTLPVNLTNLEIESNLLTRIDGSLCSPSLTYLNLEYNKIERIEKHDLYDCTNLNHVNLDNNKIYYISPTAFDRLIHLSILRLVGNRLNHIPIALRHLPVLYRLYLSNIQECTCQDDWFPQWKRNRSKSLSVSGRCSNLNISLSNFNLNCSETITE